MLGLESYAKMAAPLSAHAIKFYLAESANKSGL